MASKTNALKKAMTSAVAYGDHGQYSILDQALASSASGGFEVYVRSCHGGTTTNNNCSTDDRQNHQCIAPNAFCACDTVCAEVL